MSLGASCRTEEGVYLPNTLTNGVPKVPKGCLRDFWHFWHCHTLGTLLHAERVKPILVEVQRPCCRESLCQVCFRRLRWYVQRSASLCTPPRCCATRRGMVEALSCKRGVLVLFIRDPAYGLRRTPLLGSRVNSGFAHAPDNRGRGCTRCRA
jgi:hypothetical protein